MKNTHLVLAALIILIMTAIPVYSQEVDHLSYKAYLTTSINLWEKTVKSKEEKLSRDPENKDALYQLALAQYGLLSATIATKDENSFDKYIEGTKVNLEKLIEENDQWAEPKAILSSVYGLQMGFSPWKGMFLGSKSTKLIEKALRLEDRSPLVSKLYAGSKLFTPEMFGGDIKEAIRYYTKSIELYEANPALIKSNWLYLDALAFLGLAYEKNDQNEEALIVYTKALQHEAEFTWVKSVLLPNVQNKLEQQL